MRLVQVECPKCGLPIPPERNQGDTILLCTSCGAFHTRNGEARLVEVSVALPNRPGPGALVYVPFWRVLGYVRIFSEQVSGGTLWRLAQLFTGTTQPNEGWVNVFVPATPVGPDTFKAWATGFTNRPPMLRPAAGLGESPRLPTLIATDVAAKLADFIILSNEAEKPGTLQSISYSFDPREFHLHYFPFYWDGQAYQVGL